MHSLKFVRTAFPRILSPRHWSNPPGCTLWGYDAHDGYTGYTWHEGEWPMNITLNVDKKNRRLGWLYVFFFGLRYTYKRDR